MNHMNPATPDSLCNTDQFAKKSDLPPSYRARSAADASPDMVAGLIRYRMPLRRELPPLPFGGSVVGVFGLLLAANRLLESKKCPAGDEHPMRG